VRRDWRSGASVAAIALAVAVGGGCARTEVDVYVAGWESNGTVQVAKVWKNGAPTALSDGVHGALATGIAIWGRDVYVAGGVDAEGPDVATYWKNGAAVSLTDGTNQAFAEAIAVSEEGDVYVAGYEYRGYRTVAMIWKNGQPLALTDGTNQANAKAVAVYAGDFYAAGYEVETKLVAPGATFTTNVAKVWKNGVALSLTDGTRLAIARGIAVVGADVYVAGYESADTANFLPTVWKNGVPQRLGDGVYGAIATDVALSGADVLVSGGAHDGFVDQARMWRNGVPTDLTYATRDGWVQQAFAEAIAVEGPDVYAAGYSGGRAMLWTNGAPTFLTDGRNEADALGIAFAVH
jgi:hypothetical protein